MCVSKKKILTIQPFMYIGRKKGKKVSLGDHQDFLLRNCLKHTCQWVYFFYLSVFIYPSFLIIPRIHLFLKQLKCVIHAYNTDWCHWISPNQFAVWANCWLMQAVLALAPHLTLHCCSIPQAAWLRVMQVFTHRNQRNLTQQALQSVSDVV